MSLTISLAMVTRWISASHAYRAGSLGRHSLSVLVVGIRWSSEGDFDSCILWWAAAVPPDHSSGLCLVVGKSLSRLILAKYATGRRA